MKKQVIAGLRRIEREVQALLNELDPLQKQQTEKIKSICLWCGQPIYSSEPKIRGVHQNSCYSFAQRMVSSGEATWLKLEAEGRVAPPGRGGRKKMTPEEHRRARESAAELGKHIADKIKRKK